jgi:hypothetical protein
LISSLIILWATNTYPSWMPTLEIIRSPCIPRT